jgi:hypothetical protein
MDWEDLGWPRELEPPALGLAGLVAARPRSVDLTQPVAERPRLKAAASHVNY